jgi:NADH-quinone oxidoreductase subunit E
MSLSDEERDALDAIVGHYPDRRAAAATAMRVLQQHRGWLADESLADLARTSTSASSS